jgi:Arc/MetJ family transcription regulator
MGKRTNIVLDEDLVEAGLKATGLKTRKELVDFALRDLLRRESQKKILGLRGKIRWEGDLSEMRQGRTFA